MWFTLTGVGTICLLPDLIPSYPVHPHGRGDNGYKRVLRSSQGGSPPRAWGQYARGVGDRRSARFTPTGVGTIASERRRGRWRAVHPHGRGDNHVHAGRLRCLCGSPPRAWGQSPTLTRTPTVTRFTPTGVGTICRTGSASEALPVHPHGRGDNRVSRRASSDAHGSPPRAWGQSLRALASAFGARFTPTGVGTIVAGGAPEVGAPVHPHGLGDNADGHRVRFLVCGSPPRAWGQSVIERDMYRDMRFTPTGVGTIAPLRCARLQAPVHPHGRGDNQCAFCVTHLTGGSPPRAWGQWYLAEADVSAGRFTPTGVGTIGCLRMTTCATTVHPHGRGDNVRTPV